jgi:murein DD-endopeptidase MepM/ murein hydrolase activator NlpD
MQVGRSFSIYMALSLVLIQGGAFFMPKLAVAETVTELQTRIQDSNAKIQDLEREISQYQNQLNVVSKEKQSLQQTLTTIDISRKKTTANIQVTQNRINSTNAQIQELAFQIGSKQDQIQKDMFAVAEGLRAMDAAESNSAIETFLANSSLSEYSDTISYIEQFEDAMRGNITNLLTAKTQLEDAKVSTEDKKKSLAQLQRELADEKAVLDQTRKEKDSLLTTTKSQENQYQKILTDKKKAKEDFERQLADYESKLKFALDPSSIPHAGTGVLGWPFSSDYMENCAKLTSLGNPHCVTQTFGDTAFARAGAYSGKGHNGVDFRAPMGTKILSVLSGTVVGVGNTDAIRGCYSYGKWVLVKHANGLTSLYAHLSVISVSEGQSVETGDVLGYSGQTGYATGPHLHFGLYASPGVKVVKLTEFTGKVTPCANARMPVAGLEAYLDPLQYF